MPRIDTKPYWSASVPLPRFPTPDRDLTVDVVVIGGGITGITAAFLLKRAGRTVALIERSRCASVDTGRTTAHLTCVTDAPLSRLVKSFGEDHARAAWDAGLAAIARIDELVRAEGIDCAFAWTHGYQHAPAGREATDRDLAGLKAEADLAARLGFDAMFVESVPFFDRPGVEFDGQARFHPRRYLSALVRQIAGDGSFVFEHSSVDEVKSDPLAVMAGGHTLTCGDIVIATHNPIVGDAGMVEATLLQTKLALYTSYVVGGRMPKGIVPDALFWDTDDPYYYVRVDPRKEFDYVIVGGEDHKTGQEDNTTVRFAALEATARQLIPGLDIEHRWSGQVIETNDGLPFIGEMGPHQFAATGFSGNGMTFGTVGAMMAADWVLGRRNPWSELFDIGRTKIRGGLWDYLKENKDYPYYLIRDRFAGPEGRSLRELPRGMGKILELDGRRVAAFRDADGSVSMRSPICTHMGCEVQWNRAERSWDCPCHGSRFSPTGRVISGPAETPLEEAATVKK